MSALLSLPHLMRRTETRTITASAVVGSGVWTHAVTSHLGRGRMTNVVDVIPGKVVGRP